MANPQADLHGVLSAVVTPFTADGEDIDEAGLRAVVEHAVSAGIHGLIPCGSTGEFATLMGWADEVRKLGVRANADTPNDARVAVKCGKTCGPGNWTQACADKVETTCGAIRAAVRCDRLGRRPRRAAA